MSVLVHTFFYKNKLYKNNEAEILLKKHLRLIKILFFVIKKGIWNLFEF